MRVMEFSTRWQALRLPEECSVLIVDDHPLFRELLSTIFVRLGGKTELACDGEEAVAAFRRQPFHVLIADIQMPKMDGLEMTRVIRADEGDGRNIPIIGFSSVYPCPEQECLSAGMTSFVPKGKGALTLAEEVVRRIS
jgi:CheY-like chemotaxis protein